MVPYPKRLIAPLLPAQERMNNFLIYATYPVVLQVRAWISITNSVRMSSSLCKTSFGVIEDTAIVGLF
jgi:hypothetical protein